MGSAPVLRFALLLPLVLPASLLPAVGAAETPRTLTDRAGVLPDSPVLVKSLGDAAEHLARFRPVTTAAEWHTRRPVVERAFREALGLATLPERTQLNVRVTGRTELSGCVVENVVFESRPGFPVTANLYRALDAAPGQHPAILCPPGHHLSAGKTATEVQIRSLVLARMGFTVLAYDPIGQGERMVPGNIHHDAGAALLPLGESIAGWMVWDSLRAIDLLVSLADVDPARIGVTGNSGGGLNTFFTSALDDRVRAGAIVGFTFEFANWLKYGGAHCTCTHLPGIFPTTEWSEIAGLIAPRSVLMIQGEHDRIFPITGARHAGHQTEAIYRLLGLPERARFHELPGQPHAYSAPFRAAVYDWLPRHLGSNGLTAPLPESAFAPLPPRDRRLLCDPDHAFMPGAPTVLELARHRALALLGQHPAVPTGEALDSLRRRVAELVASPEVPDGFLTPTFQRLRPTDGPGTQEFSFLSEDGALVPGTIWFPDAATSAVPRRVVIVVSDRGRATMHGTALVDPILGAGRALVSVDLRGRGETLDRYGPRYDVNYRLAANQILLGRPLPGRRAFELRRLIDLLAMRPEFTLDDLVVVGLGDESLTVLLTAAVDPRIRRVAVSGGLLGMVSAMQTRKRSGPDLSEAWNDPQLDGLYAGPEYTADYGAVIPSFLRVADLPELAALVAPRPLLFCRTRDHRTAAAATPELVERFRTLAAAPGQSSLRFEPERALDAARLSEWLAP